MFNPENLPAPDLMGFFFHPDIPSADDGNNMRKLCAAIGYDTSFVSLESDAPQEIIDEYYDEGDLTVPKRWQPTPPTGEGWLLVAKFDTEDGPQAMFVRPLLNHKANDAN